jgi:hypothetical protein
MSIPRLMACIQSLPAKDQDFANSLINQSQKRELSERQMYWVAVLIDRALPKTDLISTDVSVSGIVELLRRNNNAKRPKIRFFIGETEFILSVAGSQARVPGSINVVSTGQWYGRIHTDGRYEPSQKSIEGEPHAVIISALNLIAQDPAKAAAEYGKKTGRCCFCFLGLDDPRSLEVGYGPVCAKHYKLPWNATKLETELLVKKLTNKQAFG